MMCNRYQEHRFGHAAFEQPVLRSIVRSTEVSKTENVATMDDLPDFHNKDEQPSGSQLQSAAKFLKALAHPLRLAMVCGLLKKSSTQTHISKVLGVPQSTVAQHLRVLRQSGVIRGVREGTTVHFEVCDPRAKLILSTVCTSLKPGTDTWEEMGKRCKPEDLRSQD